LPVTDREDAAMQLGMFMQPVHDPARDYGEVLQQDRETIILADRLGFAECWIGEHVTATTEPITSPLIFLASLIGETRRIKLGTGVFCLAIKHPAIVAAEAAMFDHLAKGRFQMGIGPGGLSSDMDLFNIGADVNRGEMVKESIGAILKIWSGAPPYEIKGKFWDIAITDMSRAAEFGVGHIVKPYQKPHPPLAVSIMSPDSMSAFIAGMHGWIPISGASLVQPRYIRSHWLKYCEGAAKAGRPEPRPEIWRVARSIMVMDSDGEAEDYVADSNGTFNYFYRYMLGSFTHRGAPWMIRPDGREQDESVDWLDCARSMLAYGSPKTVLDKLVWLREMVGDFGTLTVTAHEWDRPEKQRRSLHLLVEQVMPRFEQHMQALRAA
jgi:alkanesulfonate monooxygenase SsuD/methylene tetrahydromethanopterin reductase-like flavin-dependent oxidoreductase (luciferase family)